MISLTDNVVVITGGAGKIGREFAGAVARAGGIPIIADICEERGKAISRSITCQPGLRSEFCLLDITSQRSAESLIISLHEQYGRIDALVNNAYPRNSSYGKKFEDVTYSDFCDNVGTHLGGYFLMSQQFGLYFRSQGVGNIVNLASIYGLHAPRFEIYRDTPMTMPVEYAAIKAAIIHLTKYLAQYYKGCNIRVNSISPGGILDRQPPEFLEQYNYFAASKGMLDPEDISGTLVYLLSDLSLFINGQNIIVDDGWTL